MFGLYQTCGRRGVMDVYLGCCGVGGIGGEYVGGLGQGLEG